ncbi:MAG TPA: TRC40/GET3/ArsA family transport-energizing ATPase [Myxococcota bacterium]|nr:TRC40/GET3/ArsA family transport-energizing ATPase [Myxococcota bacterium]HRY91952.1 TRC40/GET3/ArsA family transport-energizing ATPase [Myxococcota bacterium]HSA20677.1 TRC40/GET3/ArsA family transport-energizing ATPase [Myxococcota bacterium]
MTASPHIYFFSGKGGVGKTTLAAATAVWLARRGERVLLTSTDPAHNLSDVFDRAIGHHGAWIEPNLFALEIDATARWAEATGQAAPADGAVPRPAGRLQRKLAEAVQVLGEAPGVDEMISLDLLLQAASSPDHDAVIFDTAPTGHTLRLMSLPHMLEGWFGALLSLRGHFSRLGRVFRRLLPRSREGEAEPPDLGAEMASARERVGALRGLLGDAARTSFVLVSIPEALSVLESQRTLASLAQQGIPVARVLANQVQPESPGCVHCQARRTIHLRELEHLRQVVGAVPVQVVEAKPRVVRGPDELARLGAELWGAPAGTAGG